MSRISNMVKESFKIIAPCWPLENLIAVNPLQGLEDLPIEDGLKIGSAFFAYKDLPKEMEHVNRESIKWLNAFFDEGQAIISMPLREEGLYSSWRKLALYDSKLHYNSQDKINLICELPEKPEQAIDKYLQLLNIPENDQQIFLKLLLITLSGWSSYIKQKTEWAGINDKLSYQVTQEEYLALRIVTSFLLYPAAKDLLSWHSINLARAKREESPVFKILQQEELYQRHLIESISSQKTANTVSSEAQFVFCIDVRSEPLRRAIEQMGKYQTFGFAGFFGIEVIINNNINKKSYSSCPVLLYPKHKVTEYFTLKRYNIIKGIKKFYQSLKYNFTTPFILVEIIGIFSAIYTALHCFAPLFTSKFKNLLLDNYAKKNKKTLSIDNIAFSDRLFYAENMLKMIGLTKSFAPVIVICGHASCTENNAFASALDCGACGGRSGENNAYIMSLILNDVEVRSSLERKGIKIPKDTIFIAAKHNTTTDEIIIDYSKEDDLIGKIKNDLEKARNINSSLRIKALNYKGKSLNLANKTLEKASDWAETRPEWGLARNAAFIVGNIDLRSSPELSGRCFLHSYDYNQDLKGELLSAIMTGPMIVAQWINAQYLFSTIDNVAYGSGSKITHNIAGKIGVMQGNASDLMTGLPLQSVYSSDKIAYHDLQRLLAVVFAPRRIISNIIDKNIILEKLFGNGWIQICCIEPNNKEAYILNRRLKWQKIK